MRWCIFIVTSSIFFHFVIQILITYLIPSFWFHLLIFYHGFDNEIALDSQRWPVIFHLLIRPPQSKIKKDAWKNLLIFYEPAVKNSIQSCLTPLLASLFVVFKLYCTSSVWLYLFSNYFINDFTLQRIISLIVPGKQKWCKKILRLVEIVECGGLC